MRRGESLIGLGVGVVLGAEFLKDEEGASALEGVRRVFGGDHRLDIAVAGVEAMEKVEDLARLGDEVANVTQLVSKSLELGAVVVDGHVSLVQRTQLSLKENHALQLVVAEQAFNGVPKEEGVMAIAMNHVEDAVGDGGEDPVDDAGVYHAPFAVAVRVHGGGADMALEAKLAEGRLEEETPLAIVALIHVEGNRNVVVDGDALEEARATGRSSSSSEEEEMPEWLGECAMGAEGGRKIVLG